MANESVAEPGATRRGDDGRETGAGAWLVRPVAVASALTGAIVLVGWIADIPALRSAGAEISMKANAAVCFVLLGAALWRRAGSGGRPDRLAAALAAAAALLGGVTLLEHLLGLDLGIDQLLVHEAPGMPATAAPGRMGPPASSSFLLLGTAIAVLDRRHGALRAAVPATALAVAFAALLPLVGYAYGTRQLYGIARFTGIALPTAVLLEAIAVAVLVASGLGAALRRPSGATRVARRTLVYSTLVPLVAGWAVAWGLRARLYDGTFAVSFLVLALILAVTLLTWRDVAHVARLERGRERAEAARRESEERARARAAELEAVLDAVPAAVLITHDPEARRVSANRVALELLGAPADEDPSRAPPGGGAPASRSTAPRCRARRCRWSSPQRTASRSAIASSSSCARTGRSATCSGTPRPCATPAGGSAARSARSSTSRRGWRPSASCARPTGARTPSSRCSRTSCATRSRRSATPSSCSGTPAQARTARAARSRSSSGRRPSSRASSRTCST